MYPKINWPNFMLKIDKLHVFIQNTSCSGIIYNWVIFLSCIYGSKADKNQKNIEIGVIGLLAHFQILFQPNEWENLVCLCYMIFECEEKHCLLRYSIGNA